MTRKYDFSAFLTVEADSKERAVEIAKSLEGPVGVNMPGELALATAHFSLDESEPEILDDYEDDDQPRPSEPTEEERYYSSPDYVRMLNDPEGWREDFRRRQGW